MPDLWLILDRFTIILALGASGYSAHSWWRHNRREKQLQQPIPIRLLSAQAHSVLYELPYQPPRRLITRGEVLGLLGMIPSAEAGKRFDWAHFHKPEFMRHLEDIHRARQHRLDIPLTTDEFSQLKLPRGTSSPNDPA